MGSGAGRLPGGGGGWACMRTGTSLGLACPHPCALTASLCLGCPRWGWAGRAGGRPWGVPGLPWVGLRVWPGTGLLLVVASPPHGPRGVLAELPLGACPGLRLEDGQGQPQARAVSAVSMAFSFWNVAMGFGPLGPGEGGKVGRECPPLPLTLTGPETFPGTLHPRNGGGRGPGPGTSSSRCDGCSSHP